MTTNKEEDKVVEKTVVEVEVETSTEVTEIKKDEVLESVEATEATETTESKKSDEENKTTTKEPVKVAKSKVEIDLARYKYVPIEEANLQDGVAYSKYNAIGRDNLNEILYSIQDRLEYNNYRLRNTPLSREESNEILKENENLESFKEPYIEVHESISVGDSGIPSLLDERGDFKRGISYGKDNPRLVVGMPPKVDLSAASNPNIFLNVLTAALGSASEIRFPLSASGFTITLSAPSKPELIGMVSRVNRLEQKIARSVVGYTFSAQVGETLREIIDLFLSPSHIRRCSLQVPYEDVKKYIKRADIDALLGHFAWLINPKGYNYIHTCLNTIPKSTGVEGEEEDVECGYSECATVDILDMIWYDNSKLTERQRNDLSRPAHTVEQIMEYQEVSNNNYLKEYSIIEITPDNDYNVTNKQIEKIIIKLKSPNLMDSLDNDDKWLVKLDNFIDSSGSKSLSEDNYLALANQLSSSIVLSMYSSYIKSIEMVYTDEGGQQIPIISTDPEAIESALDAISGNQEYAVRIGNKINEYIERLRIGFMGVPNKLCPKCNLPQPNEIDGIKLIPVNPLKDFFTVCHIRIQ